MQSGLFFFDMPVKSAGLAQFQKVAVKMPGQISAKSAVDDENFKAIMDTLMALSPEQLHASLEELEWVPVEEGGDTLAPLIDLGDKDDVSDEIMAFLANSEKNPTPYPFKLNGEQLGQNSEQLGRNGEQLGRNGEQQKAEREMFQSPKMTVGNNDIDQLKSHHKTLEPQAPETLFNHKNQQNKMETGLVADRGELKAPAAAAGLKPLNAISARQEELPNGVKGSGQLNEIIPKEASHAMQKPTLAQKNLSGTMDVLKDAPHADEADKMAATLIKRSVESNNRSLHNATNPKDAAGQTSLTTTNIAAEQFGAVSNNVDNQRNKNGLKANMRHNAQSASPQMDLEGAEVETNKIQPPNASKEASLSFSSRWGAMLEKSAESIAETKSSAAVPERAESTDIIKQIVQRMTLKAGRLQSQMNIKLKPEFLGNVRMQITSDNHQVVVRMVAESVVVKEMIEQNLQFLKSELQQHGIEINKFDVFVGGDSDDLKKGHEPNSQQRSQAKGQGSGEKEKEGGYDAKANETLDQQPDIQSSGNDKEIDYFA